MSAMTAITGLTSRPTLLRDVIRFDAVVTGANGIAYLALAGPLEDLLGLSSPLLRGVGAFLVVYAAFVALAGTRAPMLVIAANVAWAAGSIVAAIAGWGTPETVGTIWIVLQAITVGAFAELGLAGVKRAGRP
jgi:hypothetical protein